MQESGSEDQLAAREPCAKRAAVALVGLEVRRFAMFFRARHHPDARLSCDAQVVGFLL